MTNLKNRIKKKQTLDRSSKDLVMLTASDGKTEGAIAAVRTCLKCNIHCSWSCWERDSVLFHHQQEGLIFKTGKDFLIQFPEKDCLWQNIRVYRPEKSEFFSKTKNRPNPPIAWELVWRENGNGLYSQSYKKNLLRNFFLSKQHKSNKTQAHA